MENKCSELKNKSNWGELDRKLTTRIDMAHIVWDITIFSTQNYISPSKLQKILFRPSDHDYDLNPFLIFGEVLGTQYQILVKNDQGIFTW